MTTLRELLEPRTHSYEEARIIDRIESWAYGQERECPEYAVTQHGTIGGADLDTCPTCHGTGTIREPGLVERVAVEPGRVGGEPTYASLNSLREELGVKP